MPLIYMLFPGGKRKALTLSYDDGVEQDVRLMEIMNAHGLKGTFNLNSGLYAKEGTKYPEGQIHRRMTRKQADALYAGSGQEVALHAYEHADLTSLPPSAAAWQITKDKEEMEKQFGRIIRGFAYPYGTFDDRTVETLRGCGIAYARTVISTHAFGLPKDWLRLEATCHHNDPELMMLARRFREETPYGNPWLFYLWGHSYEFEQYGNWQVIEEFAAYLGGRTDVWYAANIEIYDYVQAWRHLIFSADGRQVYNPTAQTLFILSDGEEYRIGPGQRIRTETSVESR